MKSAILILAVFLALALAGCSNTPSSPQSGTTAQPGGTAAGGTDSSSTAKPNAGGIADMAKTAAPPVEIPPGTVIAVRLDEALSTARNQKGDTFEASLD